MNLRRCLTIISCIVCLFGSTLARTAGGGSSSGTQGGGNFVASEFTWIADDVIAKLAWMNLITIDGFVFDDQKLKSVFERTKVLSVKTPLILNGSTVHAINDRAKLEITVNEDAWFQLNVSQRTRLVIHELIGLTFPEISDQTYSYSAGLYEELARGIPRSIKAHCALFSYAGADGSGARQKIGELQNWVLPGHAYLRAKVAPFEMGFALNGPGLTIELFKTTGQVLLLRAKQHVNRNLDFELTIPFDFEHEGSKYRSLRLQCSEPQRRAQI